MRVDPPPGRRFELASTPKVHMPNVRSAVSAARRLVGDLAYERRYRVHTSGRVFRDVHDAENIYYVAVSWRQLRRALPPGSVTERDVFIDLGSGMGRAVLEAAATYPFARVIGVELIPDLHEIAQRNLATTSRRLRSTNVELVCQDVRRYRIPDDVTIFFMNNSVRGALFGEVMAAIDASYRRRPRAMRLVYHSPLEDEVIMGTGVWRRVRTVRPRRAHGLHGATFVYERSPDM